jgi:hypothetical protein
VRQSGRAFASQAWVQSPVPQKKQNKKENKTTTTTKNHRNRVIGKIKEINNQKKSFQEVSRMKNMVNVLRSQIVQRLKYLSGYMFM